MAIVITKPKPKLATKPQVPVVSDFAELIDNYGREMVAAEKVAAKIKALQEQLKPFTKAKKDLQAALDAIDQPDDKDGIMEIGTEFVCEVGKSGSQRKLIDIKGAKKMMGDELFYQVATITLKDLDKYLTEPQRDQVLETERTSRTFTVSKRVA